MEGEMEGWRDIRTAPSGLVVQTKIHDDKGEDEPEPGDDWYLLPPRRRK